MVSTTLFNANAPVCRADIVDALSSIELLVKAVQTVHVSFGLGADSTKLESDGAVDDLFSELDKALAANVLQRVLQASQKVWNELGDGSSVKDRSRHTLGDQKSVSLREISGCTGVLSLGVLGTSTGFLVLHGIDTAHASVSLDEFALTIDKGRSWRFSGTCQETTHHYGRGTHGQTLDDVANVLDTTISNAGNTKSGSK